MSMIGFFLTKKQKCISCGQVSGKGGQWEPIGLMNGPVWMCTICGAGVRLGYFSDTVLSKETVQNMLKYRDSKLG
ncbi:hypothetical protein J45TS6_45610 [Paenibacillus sp. J45TS6]|uniref:hypothetical protein n=2 Tax=unclassified Paenibacillus TaxID=185978 RepID=UPI001936CA4E|nr:hypothetical protein [Paenibacillus sp. J45TS6]BCO11078.1 hypothetical protein [Paenibacillus sp.]GIP46102.1 hypothetical protein J45TS6_45610 [Paenibacillus sp. J45TS6]